MIFTILFYAFVLVLSFLLYTLLKSVYSGRFGKELTAYKYFVIFFIFLLFPISLFVIVGYAIYKTVKNG